MNNKQVKKIAVMAIWVLAFVGWALWDQYGSHSSSHQASSQQSGAGKASKGEQSEASGASQEGEKLDFAAVADFTLAISWQPGFCESREERAECRDSDGHALALHGLWPGVPEELAKRGTQRHEWNREGCFAVSGQESGSFCSFARPALHDSTATALRQAMPGVQSCLERHEYAKHGACFNLSADQYFDHAITLFKAVNDSRFAQWLNAHRGQQVARQSILSTFGSAFNTSSRALMLMCDGDDRLTELRIGIKGEQLDNFPGRGSFKPAGNGHCGRQIRL